VTTAPASHVPFLLGTPVVVDRNMGPRIQHRKPRSKRRRIRAKWAKDPRNWRGGLTAPGTGMLMFGTYYVSPEGLRALRKACAAENARRTVTPAHGKVQRHDR
jgi:hypothetical protein